MGQSMQTSRFFFLSLSDAKVKTVRGVAIKSALRQRGEESKLY